MSAPVVLSLADVAGRLYKSERWLKDFLRAHAFGRKAGRTRLFTEADMSELAAAIANNGASVADDITRTGRYARVYVIGFGPYVKIGTSKSDRGVRIRELQTAIPEKLVVYAHLEGGRELERALHGKFKKYRLLGEWFRKRGLVATWVANGCPTGKLLTRDGVRYRVKAVLR